MNRNRKTRVISPPTWCRYVSRDCRFYKVSSHKNDHQPTDQSNHGKENNKLNDRLYQRCRSYVIVWKFCKLIMSRFTEEALYLLDSLYFWVLLDIDISVLWDRRIEQVCEYTLSASDAVELYEWSSLIRAKCSLFLFLWCFRVQQLIFIPKTKKLLISMVTNRYI